jgi:site-specific recombinase XerD
MPAQPAQNSSQHQDLTSRFSVWLAGRGTAENVITSYRSAIEEFSTWFNLIPFLQRKFTEENFRKYRERLTRRNLKAVEFNTAIHALKLLGQFLVENKVAVKNPAENLQLLSHEEMLTPAPQESVFDQFARYLRLQQLSEPTIKNYTLDAEQFFAWFNQFEKGVDLQIGSSKIIDAYRKYLQNQLGLAPASVDR